MRWAGAVLVLAGLAGACGGDSSADEPRDDAVEETSTTAAETTTTAPPETTTTVAATTLPEGATAFRGILFTRDDEGEERYFAGVDITVADADGEVVGRATTDADGAWGIEVGVAGTYTAALDAEDLPDDVQLRREEPLELMVRTDQVKIVLFSLEAA